MIALLATATRNEENRVAVASKAIASRRDVVAGQRHLARGPNSYSIKYAQFQDVVRPMRAFISAFLIHHVIIPYSSCAQVVYDAVLAAEVVDTGLTHPTICLPILAPTLQHLLHL